MWMKIKQEFEGVPRLCSDTGDEYDTESQGLERDHSATVREDAAVDP